MDLIQILYNWNILPNGIVSTIILLTLFAIIIQKIRIEIEEQINKVFKNIQENTKIGNFSFPGNIPITENDYNIIVEKITLKMKEHRIVKIYFLSDNNLRRYIIKQFEGIFKIIGVKPV